MNLTVIGTDSGGLKERKGKNDSRGPETAKLIRKEEMVGDLEMS